ncbi:MAG: Gfo/Idh/MocA family oxidoreductase [Acidobacteria bacterium]|nr:Gfo/Idh/MocA family oxidoreductase [Acidobacteriota bacterium]
MKVAIVGCGLIGRKRALALQGEHRVVAVADVVRERAQALAGAAGCAARTWRDAVTDSQVDVVVVATTNNCLAPVTLAAIEAGKHVLVEKPAARNTGELQPVVEAAGRRGVIVQVGFNHRYHPALQKARELVDAGTLGPLLFVRGRYGHGGRIGYDREWRADPEVAGGGGLLDQGVHLIDLARWFLGDFDQVLGHADTYFWDMPVEDNGFLLLHTPARQTAWLHASCSEWKNLFSLEVYGRLGKLQVDGLGGSYGIERLAWYRMPEQMGPPETTIWEYPGEDRSWMLEMRTLARAIEAGRPLGPTLEDARAALEIVERVYRLSGR